MDLVGMKHLSQGLRRALLAIALGIAFALVISGAALGQVRLSQEECRELGNWVERMAEVRDIGADVEKHVAWMKSRHLNLSRSYVGIMESELRAVYGQPKMTPSQASTSVYSRCMAGVVGGLKS